MSSMVRTIRRNMICEAARSLLKDGKLTCPKCKNASLQGKNMISRKMLCPICGWKGRIK